MKEAFAQAQREFDDMQQKADEEIARYLQSIERESGGNKVASIFEGNAFAEMPRIVPRIAYKASSKALRYLFSTEAF